MSSWRARGLNPRRQADRRTDPKFALDCKRLSYNQPTPASTPHPDRSERCSIVDNDWRALGPLGRSELYSAPLANQGTDLASVQ